jgi:hypothetical protein
MIGVMNNRIFSVLCAIGFSIFLLPSALAQEATSSSSGSGSTLVEAKAKLNSQILEARKLGIGTKQLEDGISEADAELNQNSTVAGALANAKYKSHAKNSLIRARS